MKKVFLHQLRKNLWFDVIMLICWEFFILAEEGRLCWYNLYLLIALTCIILIRCLTAPKLLYWFRRSQIVYHLNQVRENPETTMLQMDCLIANVKYIKIPMIQEEDVLDMYPNDLKKLENIVKKFE